MQIQMVDLHTQYMEIKTEIDAAVQTVLESTAFIRGPEVDRFERALADYLGARYVVGVGNGTDALQIALMAAGVGPEDEVVTSAFTFIATAEAAALLGARVVFADIDAESFNLNPSAVEDAMTPRTRAIVPVHLFGQPADMDPILEIARSRDVAVIEDNAQSIGARYRDRMTGTCGIAGCLSFFPSKNLGAYGDGGAITTDDEALHERVRMVANHGSSRKYYNEVVGVNSRLDTLQAAILSVKLRHMDRYVRARTSAANRYDALLSEVPGVTTPPRVTYGTHVFHQYTIRIDPSVRSGREGLAKHLREEGIPSAVYYPVPLHQLPVFSGKDHAARFGDLTETERAAREVISLPMHTELTSEQQERIADAVRSYAT